MRTAVLLFSLGLVVTGCKDPGAGVTAATVESPAGAKADPTPGTDLASLTVTSLAISPLNSKIEFVGAKVTARHPGGFADFAGTLELGDPIEKSQIEITIQTASLYADKEKLTKHLKSPDFFDVAQFPTATFRSMEIKKSADGHSVAGDLTLHGVTKRISFPVTVHATDAEVTATAEFSIDRQDYGISYPGMRDDLIRDRVVIKLSLKVPRQS
jgi:polyisoprenoid-binding protein YceI